jgi:ferredoxin
MLKVSVDRDLCIGSGNCANLAPRAFALDEQQISVVIDPEAATEEQLRAAERSCPVGAILLQDG